MASKLILTMQYYSEVKVDPAGKASTLETANLWREYADWLESMDGMYIEPEGTIGLKSGSVSWRIIP